LHHVPYNVARLVTSWRQPRDEMDNLFDDGAHRALRGELMERLAYREMELADRSPLLSDLA
jgi:hypothetical protein